MSVREKYLETQKRLFDTFGIQPESRFVRTNGLNQEVHYLELGSGKPLLLVHGGGGHSSEWIPILKPLSEHFHLYVPDRPGHGLTGPFNYRQVDFRKSAVDFLSSFMDAVELSKAFFLANSMGGYFSLCMALAQPERVEKLMLIGAPAGIYKWIPPVLRLLGWKGVNRFLLKTVAKPSISNTRNLYRQLLVADINNLSDTYIEHNYYHQLLPDMMLSFSTLLEQVLNLRGWRSELYLGDELQDLSRPVGFIWGDQDAFEKPATGRLKATTIAKHTFEIVNDAGHCPWLDQPQICADLIINHLHS